MILRPQHKVVYNVPTGAEGGFNRVEVLAPLGVSVGQLKQAVQEYLRTHPGAQLLSHSWSDRDL